MIGLLTHINRGSFLRSGKKNTEPSLVSYQQRGPLNVSSLCRMYRETHCIPVAPNFWEPWTAASSGRVSSLTSQILCCFYMGTAFARPHSRFAVFNLLIFIFDSFYTSHVRFAFTDQTCSRATFMTRRRQRRQLTKTDGCIQATLGSGNRSVMSSL